MKEYEAGKPSQHPVGMTAQQPGVNSALYASPADWISPHPEAQRKTIFMILPPLTPERLW